MSRSRQPKCPRGRDCGVCHPGKRVPPVCDQRRARTDAEVHAEAIAAKEDAQMDAALDWSTCPCSDCAAIRARAEMPETPR